MFDPNIALSQLCYHDRGGAGILKMMVGAKNYVRGDNWVQFQFMRGAKNKATRMKIALNSKDLYDVEFFSVFKGEKKLKGLFPDVYCEDLKSLFEAETALYLSV